MGKNMVFEAGVATGQGPAHKASGASAAPKTSWLSCASTDIDGNVSYQVNGKAATSATYNTDCGNLNAQMSAQMNSMFSQPFFSMPLLSVPSPSFQLVLP